MKNTSIIIELIKAIATIIILTFIIKTFLIQTYIIDGDSMEPNFHNSEYLIIDKLSYRLKEPKRGDVVILIPKTDLNKNFIKRIIGLPGDNIEIFQNNVIVNGQKLEEPYLKNNERTQVGSSIDNDYKVTLKSDEYFVLGDNRTISMDSRVIGTVPRENIVGRTMLVLFPLDNIRVVKHLSYSSSPVTTFLPSINSNQLAKILE